MDKFMEMMDEKSRASKYMATQGSDKGGFGLNFGKSKQKRDLDAINKDLTDSVGLDTEQSAAPGKKKGKKGKKTPQVDTIIEEPQEMELG